MNNQLVHEIPKVLFRIGDHFVRGRYYRNGMGKISGKRFNLEMLK